MLRPDCADAAGILSRNAPAQAWESGKNVVWFGACATILVVVPILVEMQREAMIAVEKQSQAEQQEQMMQQMRQVQESAGVVGNLASLVTSGGKKDESA